MRREDLIERIVEIISKHKVHSTVEVDGTTILYLYWNNCKNYIQIEGFDTENIYVRKYINCREVNNNKIIKIHTAPYKVLRKVYDFLSAHYKV